MKYGKFGVPVTIDPPIERGGVDAFAYDTASRSITGAATGSATPS